MLTCGKLVDVDVDGTQSLSRAAQEPVDPPTESRLVLRHLGSVRPNAESNRAPRRRQTLDLFEHPRMLGSRTVTKLKPEMPPLGWKPSSARPTDGAQLTQRRHGGALMRPRQIERGADSPGPAAATDAAPTAANVGTMLPWR